MADIQRGCGTRIAGALYISCPLSKDGVPLEKFLMDPPVYEVEVDGEMVPISEAFGLSPLGVTLVEMGGVCHVIDIVGSQHYPNVTDFLEEVRFAGLSRRISKGTDFSKLTRDSKIVVAHARGHIEEHARYFANEEVGEMRDCPRQDELHQTVEEEYEEMCARMFWQDVLGGEKVSEEESRRVRVQMPAFSYEAFSPPENVISEHKLALVAAFPIHHIEAIRDSEQNTHEQAMEKASMSGISVSLEDL